VCGAVKAASQTTKAMGRTRPAPRCHPLGRQSREARPRMFSLSCIKANRAVAGQAGANR
jgi:hypothetical protein